jgi:hypothetical protein
MIMALGSADLPVGVAVRSADWKTGDADLPVGATNGHVRGRRQTEGDKLS